MLQQQWYTLRRDGGKDGARTQCRTCAQHGFFLGGGGTQAPSVLPPGLPLASAHSDILWWSRVLLSHTLEHPLVEQSPSEPHAGGSPSR